MKKIFTLAWLMAFAGSLQAQQVLFKEGFEFMPGLGLSQGWKTQSSGAVGWRTSHMYNLYCSYSYVPQYKYFAKVAAISGCYGDRGGPRNNRDVFAYTKSINLSNVQKGAFLKYDSYFNRMTVNNVAEKATVEVSINDGASWTVVQVVPPGNTVDSFQTLFVNLSQYIGYGNVRIGFRYSDRGQDQMLGGWAIDDIELFRPEQKDLSLEIFSPTDSLLGYAAVNNTLVHTGTVLNKGLDTIQSFVVHYRRGNGYALSDTYNVTIPPLTKFNFTHKVPDTVFQIGRTDITAWIEVPGDANHANDTMHTFVQGAHFMPKKVVMVEHGTGTWNRYGLLGIVYMKALHDDNEANLAAIHTSDPMDYEHYADYFYGLNYYSGVYFMVDRRYADWGIVFPTFARHRQHFGFADLELHGGINRNWIEVGVAVKPAVDMKGDFKLMLVITEDKLSGNTLGWTQVNGYASGKLGPMGGFENKPNPVPSGEMQYDFVARKIAPAPDGGPTFATELKYGGNYFHRFNIELDENWDKNRLRAIVMLFRNDDTLILNSAKLNYFLDVTGAEQPLSRTGIYPNPADEYTMLEFDANENEKAEVWITDINGRRVNHMQLTTTAGTNSLKIATHSLPAGLYIVNILTEQQKSSLKLQVLH